MEYERFDSARSNAERSLSSTEKGRLAVITQLPPGSFIWAAVFKNFNQN